MKKKIFIFLIIFIAFIISFSLLKNRNPYNDVIWEKDFPGATGRYVKFTPVLKSNPKIKLGSGFGADYGVINFEDIDNDGIKETIIQTKQPFYSFDDAITSTKIILKYNKNGNENPTFTIIEKE